MKKTIFSIFFRFFVYDVPLEDVGQAKYLICCREFQTASFDGRKLKKKHPEHCQIPGSIPGGSTFFLKFLFLFYFRYTSDWGLSYHLHVEKNGKINPSKVVR